MVPKGTPRVPRKTPYGSEGWGFESLRTRQAFPQVTASLGDTVWLMGCKSAHQPSHLPGGVRSYAESDNDSRLGFGS